MYRIVPSDAPKERKGKGKEGEREREREKSRKWNSPLAKGKEEAGRRSSLCLLLTAAVPFLLLSLLFLRCTLLLVWTLRTSRGNFLSLFFLSSSLYVSPPHRVVGVAWPQRGRASGSIESEQKRGLGWGVGGGLSAWQLAQKMHGLYSTSLPTGMDI